MREFLLKTPIDDAGLERILQKIDMGQRVFHVFINLHKIVLFQKNHIFREIERDASSVFSIDGQWIVWLLKAYKLKPKEVSGGLNVMHGILSLADRRGLKVYLLGAQRQIVDATKEVFKKQYPGIKSIDVRDGYFNDEREVVSDIERVRPHVLFIALPSPAKERIGYMLFNKVESIVYLAGVGGAFDIIAKQYRRAPIFLREAGLEWLYRCLQKPSLFKRYFYDFFYILKLMIYEGCK